VSLCKTTRRFLLAGVVLALPSQAAANDSIAHVGAGGLILSRTDAISMDSEVLRIAETGVEVDYVFRNGTDKDVTTIVAFPMPDISGSPYDVPSLPHDTDDNFLDFSVTVDGAAVTPQLEQRAFAVGLDVTDELARYGIPVYPFKDVTSDALARLQQDVADDFVRRGLVALDTFDDGSGWQTVRVPLWELKSTYWWETTFPAGRSIPVSHRYLPSVGASVGLSFFLEGRFGGEYDDYKQRYCMDEAFENAVRRAARESDDPYAAMNETRLEYVLTTGGNWATGVIGSFKLTIDKGAPENLVSFCGTGVRKTGPTTFEMTAQDFYPAKDIDVLILKPNRAQEEAPGTGDGG